MSVTPEEAATIRAEIKRLNDLLEQRDSKEFTGIIEAALKAAGFSIAAPDVARLVIQQAAMGAPTDTAAAALDLAAKYPAVFTKADGEQDRAIEQTTEERAMVLKAEGIIPAERPTREQFIADAKAGENAATATPKQREAYLRSQGMI